MSENINYFDFARSDLQPISHLRIYSQAEQYVDSQGKLLQFPFNQNINEAVGDLHILNKEISSNLKNTRSIIDNGKSIYESKRECWEEFCKYHQLEQLFLAMSLGKKEVIVFSVMALSNLLLKLCISITKINVTFLNRFLLPSKISPPVLAIAFFQFLNLKMYQTHSEDQKISISGDNALPTVDPGEKEKQMFNERQKYVGELPKITVVKLCYRRNPDDRKLILNSQKEFKEVAIELVQFIELFQHEQKQQTHPLAVNLRTQLSLCSPFSFGLFYYFQNYLVDKIKEFSPQGIMLIEDYPSDKVSICPQVRGLIINQLMTKITDKVQVTVEYGMYPALFRDILPKRDFYEHTIDYLLSSKDHLSSVAILQFFESVFTRIILDMRKRCLMNILYEQKKIDQSNLAEESFNVSSIIEEVRQISQDIGKKDVGELHKRFFTGINFIQVFEEIQKCRKILFAIFPFLSRALIQKTNFQTILRESQNYIYPSQFLEKMKILFLKSIYEVKKLQYLNPTQKTVKQQRLIAKISTVEDMLFVSYAKLSFATQLSSYHSNITCVRNLVQNRNEQLSFFVQGSTILEKLELDRNDQSLVVYRKEGLFVFVISQQRKWYYLLYKRYQQEGQPFVCRKANRLGTEKDLPMLSLATLVASYRYLYVGFGIYADENASSSIYRLALRESFVDQQLNDYNWQYLKEKTDKKTLELEYKQEGFGFYDDRNNKIIFLGGYNYRSHNEQKVNKFIYLIDENKDFRVKRLNKTTKSLFPIDKNFTSKNALFPLVYGLPLFVESKELNNSLLILSSNGFKEDINHSNRLFISTLNLTEDTANIGFSSLMRLQYGQVLPNNQKDINVSRNIQNRKTAMKLMIGSYSHTNIMGSKLALFDENNQIAILETGLSNPDLKEKFVNLKFISAAQQQIMSWKTFSLRFSVSKKGGLQ